MDPIPRENGGRLETYRGVVHGCDCDLMGHLNTVRYAAIFDSATWTMLRHLGYRWTREGRTGWADVRNVFEYAREIPVDSKVFVQTSISQLGRTSLKIYHRLHVEGASEDSSATAEIVLVRFDLRQRRPEPFPEEFREAAAPFLDESHPRHETG